MAHDQRKKIAHHKQEGDDIHFGGNEKKKIIGYENIKTNKNNII